MISSANSALLVDKSSSNNQLAMRTGTDIAISFSEDSIDE